MAGSGFVERSDAGVYRLGIRLLELGSPEVAHLPCGNRDAGDAPPPRRHR